MLPEAGFKAAWDSRLAAANMDMDMVMAEAKILFAEMTKLAEIGGREDWLVKFGQGFQSMSPAMRDLERLMLGHRLAHGNNPVLTWMADNLVVATDAAANIKPDKEHSIERIDGMVALIMCIGTAMRGGGQKQSIYGKRGVLTL